ncbi:MAG: hypothetical protein AAGI24_08200 [Pseudomonadota bacterium]
MAPVLDINDSSLGLWENGALRLSSPGYALLDKNQYRFGELARNQARLQPRQINHRYWAQLDLEPLTPAFGPGRHSADIVHAHLMEIYEQGGRPEQLVIAAPGSLQHEQLALLLGIADSCPFTVTGLVDRAVAATTVQPVAAYNWHVEVQLNQALLTGMRLENGQLINDKTVPIPGSGWLALQEALARAIADAFIRQTRFDPRRAAQTEQALYNAIPDILSRLQQASETNVDIDGRQARVEREALAEACNSHYQRIARTVMAEQAAVFLSPVLAQLPAIENTLQGARSHSEDAVFQGVARNTDAMLGDDGGVHFIVSLPADADTGTHDGASSTPESLPEPAKSSAAAAKPVAEKTAPTRCQIVFDNGKIALHPGSGPALRLNGAPLQDEAGVATLRDGDLLEDASGKAWRLVAAEGHEDHGK